MSRITLICSALFMLATHVSMSQFTEYYDVSGTVVDADTKEPLPGLDVSFYGSGKRMTATNDSGQYQFEDAFHRDDLGKMVIDGISAPAGNGHRYLNVIVDHYAPLNCFGSHGPTFIRDYELQCASCGEIPLPTIYYSLGKWNLVVNDDINSLDSLRFLYQVLINNPTIVIELQGHTDARGHEKSNSILSQKRVQMCADKLIEWGIAPDRMVPVGYGESKPLIGEEEIRASPSAQERERMHAKNRRTSFSVLAFDYEADINAMYRYKLSGTIRDLEDGEPLGNVRVKLLGTDSSIQIRTTDATGYYEFEWNEDSTRAVKAQTSYTVEVDGMSEEASNGEKYLGSKGQESTMWLFESTHFVKDFMIVSASGGCGGMAPSLTFDYMSSELCNNAQCRATDTLDYIVQLMDENPTIIVEIASHTDFKMRKRKRAALAHERGEAVKRYLTEMGVNADRLIIVSYGATRPVISKAQFKQLPKSERHLVHDKNNRVVFSILSFDYESKKTDSKG